MRALVLSLVALGVVGLVVTHASVLTPPVKEPIPPDVKGYDLGPTCGQLTILDAPKALAWAYDQGLAAKSKADAFAAVSAGCSQSSLKALIKAPATAGFMYLLGRATLKGLVAGGGLDKSAAQELLSGWRAMALAAGVAAELLPEDV